MNVIIQRGVLLAVFFGLISFMCLVRFWESGRRLDYLIAFLSFLLALFSKPFVMTLPFVFFLYGVFFLQGIPKRNLLRGLLPFVAMSLIPVLYLKLLGLNVQVNTLPWYEYFLVQTRVVFLYFRLFFFPVDLHFFYDITPDSSVFRNLTWLAILAHLAVLGFAATLVKRRPLTSFAIFSMYLALLPESGIFPIQHLAFEHRTYFPYLFLLLAIWSLLWKLGSRSLRGAAIAILFLLPVLAGATIARNAQLDTPLKWTLNAFRYYKKDLNDNLKMIEQLILVGEPEQAKTMLVEARKHTGPHAAYDLFEGVLAYETFPRERQWEFLERVRFVLHAPVPDLPFPYAREYFSFFVVRRLPGFLPADQADRAGERLLRSQLYVMTRPQLVELFHGALSYYLKTALAVRERLRRELRAGRNIEDHRLFLRVTTALFLYYDVGTAAEVDAEYQRIMSQFADSSVFEADRKIFVSQLTRR